MKPALNHHDLAILNSIDQPMFAVDTPRPTTGEIVFKWFRFTNTRERCGLNGFEERTDAGNEGGIGFLPERQVARGALGKANLQRSTSTVLPCAASVRLCVSAARLFAVEAG